MEGEDEPLPSKRNISVEGSLAVTSGKKTDREVLSKRKLSIKAKPTGTVMQEEILTEADQGRNPKTGCQTKRTHGAVAKSSSPTDQAAAATGADWE